MQRAGVGLAALLVLIGPRHSEAGVVQAFQGGDFLGTIAPYTGPDSAFDNYNAWGVHPLHGPTLEVGKGFVFF